MAAIVGTMLAIASPVRAFIGDVSGDSRVDTLDARLVAGFLVGTSTSLARPENADVNNDGQITTADALLIMQVSKGLRTSFTSNALEVLAVMPSSGTTGVQLTANFSVFFSEPVLSGSLSGITLTDTATSLTVAGTFQPSQDGVIATFVPSQPLQPDRNYRIDVTTAVRDNGGRALVQSFTSSFRTQVLGTGVLVSTTGLSAPVNELAPQPVIFKALNSLGVPVKQAPVVFTAKMGSGHFEPSGNRQITVLTDDNGIAQATFRLGGEALLNTVEISAVGFSTVPKYTALASALPAVNLRLYNGSGQNGSPGSTAPAPLIVQATDAGGNPVTGTTVTFRLLQGQGNFGGLPTANVPTDSSGTVSTFFTFGTASGTLQVQATFPGMLGLAPVFNFQSLIPNPSSPTAIVGKVLDATTLQPLAHVYVYLADSPSTWDWTNEAGLFRLVTTPGSHVVDVDGFESGAIGGHLYPVVAIPVNAIEGQDNDIGMPALLPQLDSDSYIDVSDTQGGTLTLRSNPLWKIYVAPGQARFANGTGTGRLYVAAVPPDRIPMPPAGGRMSRFFDTIQPLNVIFNPPAQVSFPNLDNLPAGTVTDIFTLSYSSGIFVKTGRGQVSEDGAVIASLPGAGITQGGWHQAPAPAPTPDTTATGKAPGCHSHYIMGGMAATMGADGAFKMPGVPSTLYTPAGPGGGGGGGSLPGTGGAGPASGIFACGMNASGPPADDGNTDDEEKKKKKKCKEPLTIRRRCSRILDLPFIDVCQYICFIFPGATLPWMVNLPAVGDPKVCPPSSQLDQDVTIILEVDCPE